MCPLAGWIAPSTKEHRAHGQTWRAPPRRLATLARAARARAAGVPAHRAWASVHPPCCCLVRWAGVPDSARFPGRGQRPHKLATGRAHENEASLMPRRAAAPPRRLRLPPLKAQPSCFSAAGAQKKEIALSRAWGLPNARNHTLRSFLHASSRCRRCPHRFHNTSPGIVLATRNLSEDDALAPHTSLVSDLGSRALRFVFS